MHICCFMFSIRKTKKFVICSNVTISMLDYNSMRKGQTLKVPTRLYNYGKVSLARCSPQGCVLWVHVTIIRSLTFPLIAVPLPLHSFSCSPHYYKVWISASQFNASHSQLAFVCIYLRIINFFLNFIFTRDKTFWLCSSYTFQPFLPPSHLSQENSISC